MIATLSFDTYVTTVFAPGEVMRTGVVTSGIAIATEAVVTLTGGTDGEAAGPVTIGWATLYFVLVAAVSINSSSSAATNICYHQHSEVDRYFVN